MVKDNIQMTGNKLIFTRMTLAIMAIHTLRHMGHKINRVKKLL